MLITEQININDTVAETFDFGDIDQTVQGQALPVYSLANGTAQGQVDLHYESPTPVTLAAGGTLTLTLSALTDGEARTVAFARVKKLLVWITSRIDLDYLTVGGAATHPWTAVATFVVYDLEMKVNNSSVGFVVTAGSSDQVLITNSGTHPITFMFYLTGCSV